MDKIILSTKILTLYLPEGLPLLGYNGILEYDPSSTDLSPINLILVLERTSAQSLHESGILNDLTEVPTHQDYFFWLELELVLKKEIWEQNKTFFSHPEQASQDFIEGKFPNMGDNFFAPVYDISSYELIRYTIHTRQ
jgi:hypothetical protein